VTEQVEDHLGLERELVRRRQLEQELIRLERLGALSELSAGISHNLNNLLTGILVPAQMLRLEIQDQDQAEALDTIVVSARRASDLVQRLHRWSRRQEEAGVGAVSLNATVAEVVRASEPIWKDEPEARGVAIHVEQRLQEVRPVRGTIAGMHDILTNLLLNAVAALPRGGTITIATRPAGDAVELVFADDGVGMDEETRLRVFEPFFTTRKDVGSGLGLATVYGMVQRWGGQIQVASAPGQGATFVLRLPTAENEPPGRRDLEDAPDSGSRGRLLVVEDEAAVARTMELLLGGRHEVDVARSAKEGLERARANGYDVALIDLGLPDRSGDQLALELRQLDPGLVLVLVTGWLLDEEDPRRAPFDYVLQKPFTDLTEVLDIVAQSGRREDR
jgi:CheY-like chemotaxis protein